MEFSANDRKKLIKLCRERNIYLEGNVLKILQDSGDDKFKEYIENAIERDKEMRKKRLTITKTIQEQNRELKKTTEENHELMEELRETIKVEEKTQCELKKNNTELLASKEENKRVYDELRIAIKDAELAKLKAETAKKDAENDLDLIQRKGQSELTGIIAKYALFMILSVGLITTGLFIFSLITGKETQLISSTWSNLFGILLTNSFSIVGTIMGIKYGSENEKK